MKITSHLFSKDQFKACLAHFLPESSGLELQKVELSEDELQLVVKATERERPCPVCGVGSTRVQSHYQRTLQDLPWIDLRVKLHLHVRRFFCSNASCSCRIFTERLPDVAPAYARRTDRLCQVLVDTGWSLGGEAGSRLCDKQAKPVAASTLHR